MPVKHFVINPKKGKVSLSDIVKIEKKKQENIDKRFKTEEEIADMVMAQPDTLINPNERVIIKVNVEKKNEHTFQNGQVIRRERVYNDFNRRVTQPVNAVVISSAHIPQNTEILVSHNAIHDSYRIFNYKDESPRIHYYSIKESECYLWKDEHNNWKPFPPYETALRVFKPYDGNLENIDPTLIDKILYVTSGELKGNIVSTLLACDYQIIFQGVDGREDTRIRFLPNGYEQLQKEEEAICIRHDLTELLNKNKLLIGYTISDCKTLKQWQQTQKG